MSFPLPHVLGEEVATDGAELVVLVVGLEGGGVLGLGGALGGVVVVVGGTEAGVGLEGGGVLGTWDELEVVVGATLFIGGLETGGGAEVPF